MDARQIMKAAEAKADEVARESLPTVDTKACRRCKGTGLYTLASGAKDACISCVNGRVPANDEARQVLAKARVERELKRLRILWAGARDALKTHPSKSQAWEFEYLQKTVEASAAKVKATPNWGWWR